ncbi:MAG: hypothetical protein K0R07_1088 [Sedimentibacter sp.]|nr:hypothetical protein [Sedimentibacter sp.]
MPRPRKWRNVCFLPESNRFGHLDSAANCDSFIIMTVDEYETIRLMDLVGLSQLECANKMNVARTTIQGIYSEARRKIAESLVNGKVLKIEGGDYILCNDDEKKCELGNCRRCRRVKCNS